MLSRPPIAVVVQQHAEESAILHALRTAQSVAPHVKLHHLRRFDDRLAAHLDGIAVAGEFGSALCDAALENPSRGAVFVAAVRAIESKDTARLDRLFALAEALPDAERGLTSAFGWVSAPLLAGIGAGLLTSTNPLRRRVGLAACAMHRVDPGTALATAIADADPSFRARALRCASQVGRRDLLAACQHQLNDEVIECRFRAAQSVVLLGERGDALAVLAEIAQQPGPFCTHALATVLFAADAAYARALLERIAAPRDDLRTLIRGVAYAGDAHYVPWLIKQMADEKLARLAGESFSFITGLDLAYLDLERKPPENVEAGPNDDPNDDNVAMDEDDSLPWPDQSKIEAWWKTNSSRFQPGVRTFMGEPVRWEHCVKVLKEGYQRQRMAAAQYLCLLRPGTMLFNCAAPAWRQKRWLEKMV